MGGRERQAAVFLAVTLLAMSTVLAGSALGQPGARVHAPVPGFGPLAPATGTDASQPTSVIGVLATVGVGAFPANAVDDPSNGWVYVANEGSDSVSVLRGSSVLATVSTGAEPSGMVYDSADGSVYVASSASNSVTVIQGTVASANVSVGAEPGPPAYDPLDGDVFVPDFGADNVSILNGSSIVATVGVGDDPADATFDPASGTVYVTNEESGTETVLAGTTVVGTSATRLTTPFDALYDPVNEFLYVTNYTPTGGGAAGVSVYEDGINTASFLVGPGAQGLAVDIANGWLYLPISGTSQVQVINGTTLGPLIAVNGEPSYAVFDNASGLVYVLDDLTDSVAVINGTRVVDNIPVETNPSVATYDPGDGYVYVADKGADAVSVIGPVPGWAVTFTETGLATGTAWSVLLRQITLVSSTSSIVHYEPNGTFYYWVNPVPGYSYAPASGGFPLQGGPVNVAVVFNGTIVTTVPLLLGVPWYVAIFVIAVVVGPAAVLSTWAWMGRRERKRDRILRL